MAVSRFVLFTSAAWSVVYNTGCKPALWAQDRGNGDEFQRPMMMEFDFPLCITVVVWLSGNVVGHISEVILHRVGLVLRWVTVPQYTILVFN